VIHASWPTAAPSLHYWYRGVFTSGCIQTGLTLFREKEMCIPNLQHSAVILEQGEIKKLQKMTLHEMNSRKIKSITVKQQFFSPALAVVMSKQTHPMARVVIIPPR